MGQISEGDRKTIVMMKEAGVLQGVDGHRLPTTNGVILVFCGDGDQSLDLLETTRTIFVAGDRVRPHLLARNGGALLLPGESPLHREKPATAHDLLDEIFETRTLKGIDTVVLCAHAPCGKAGQFDLSIEDVVRLLKAAKMCVQRSIADMIVACFIHVDRGNGNGKKTYFLNGERWRAWNALSSDEREARYGVAAV